MVSVLERITINNILAFMIIGVYCGMWALTLYIGITADVPTEQDQTRLSVLLASIEAMSPLLTTMTIIVVIVVQFYFRTSPKSIPPPE